MLSRDKVQLSKGPLTKEDLQKVKDLLDGIEKDPQAYDFAEPVDFIGKFKIIYKIRTWIGRLSTNN
jgi:hypothetical protein